LRRHLRQRNQRPGQSKDRRQFGRLNQRADRGLHRAKPLFPRLRQCFIKAGNRAMGQKRMQRIVKFTIPGAARIGAKGAIALKILGRAGKAGTHRIGIKTRRGKDAAQHGMDGIAHILSPTAQHRGQQCAAHNDAQRGAIKQRG
jgi:hypothetical protein